MSSDRRMPFTLRLAAVPSIYVLCHDHQQNSGTNVQISWPLPRDISIQPWSTLCGNVSHWSSGSTEHTLQGFSYQERGFYRGPGIVSLLLLETRDWIRHKSQKASTLISTLIRRSSECHLTRIPQGTKGSIGHKPSRGAPC